METFILRIWPPTDAGAGAPPGVEPLRGFVDDVSQGRTEPFRDEGQLVSILRAASLAGGRPTRVIELDDEPMLGQRSG